MESPHAALTFTVAGKPRAKGRPWATTRYGKTRVYTPPATVAYEAIIQDAALSARADRPPFEGAVGLLIRIRLQPPRSSSAAKRQLMLSGQLLPTKRPDLDNVQKAIMDACSGILFRDDADVLLLQAEKVYHAEEGVDVTVHPLVTAPSKSAVDPCEDPLVQRISARDPEMLQPILVRRCLDVLGDTLRENTAAGEVVHLAHFGTFLPAGLGGIRFVEAR